MTDLPGYESKWSYSPSTAITYNDCFLKAAQGLDVRVQLSRSAKSVATLNLTLRVALHWLRKHGAFNDLHVRFINEANSVLIQPKRTLYGLTGYGSPYVMQDSTGRTTVQHAPPDLPQAPPRKRKRK